MIWLIGFVHVIVCIMLIVIVLLQKGKGQDFASTFGGGGTQTAFGARSGATLLHRATTVAAVLFMITSLTLTIMKSRPAQSSVLQGGETAVQSEPAPPLPINQPEAGAAAPAEENAAPDVEVGVQPDTDTGAPAAEEPQSEPEAAPDN